MSALSIAQDYFERRPEMKVQVDHAYYAYHATRLEPGGHLFEDQPGSPNYRHVPCGFCGRTRYDVRYSDDDPRCPGPLDVSAIVLREEEAFLKLLKNAPEKVRKHVGRVEDLTGEMLAWLHHTHGIVPETVESAFGTTLSTELMEAYEEATGVHKKASVNTNLRIK